MKQPLAMGGCNYIKMEVVFMFRDCYFEYAGISSQPYGLIMCYVENSNENFDSGGKFELKTDTLPRSHETFLYGKDYSAEPLSFDIEIVCIDDYIPLEQMTEIKNWLFGQDGWKTLRVLDERQNYNLKCIFEPKEDIVDGIGYRGVRCTIHNISPFWYGDEQIITFNHSDLTRDWKYFSSVGWSFINIEVPDNGCADVDILPRLSVEFDRSGSSYGTYYGSLFNLISVDAPSVADVAQNYHSNSAWNYKDLSGVSFDYAYITENSKTTATVSRNMREDGVLEILLGEDVLLEIPDGEDTDEFMKTKLRENGYVVHDDNTISYGRDIVNVSSRYCTFESETYTDQIIYPEIDTANPLCSFRLKSGSNVCRLRAPWAIKSLTLRFTPVFRLGAF